MNFQGALTLLKDGKKVRCASWTGGRFVVVAIRTATDKSFDLYWRDGQYVRSCPWLPIADDFFAEDWEVLPEYFNFQRALEMLKRGLRVRHESWAPDRFVRLLPSGIIQAQEGRARWEFIVFEINEMLSDKWMLHPTSETSTLDAAAFMKP